MISGTQWIAESKTYYSVKSDLQQITSPGQTQCWILFQEPEDHQ